MKILHGALADDHFLVWGETDTPQVSTAKKSRRSAKRTANASALPYGIPKKDLNEACSFAGWDAAVAGKATAWMPTAGDMPVASSPMIAEPLPNAEPASLAPWDVDVLAPGIKDLFLFLLHCSGNELLTPGILAGHDLMFWSKASRFAAELTVRQTFLPSVRKEGEQYFAVWQPALPDKEQKQFQQLASMMPPACRALNRSVSAPPDVPASAMLFRFVSMMVDHLVRSANPPVTKTAKKSFDSIHDQWAYALRSTDGKMNAAISPQATTMSG